ncbi:MAG: malto-oligosyltrehalose synthase [Bryobacterales bacterium]|nr:malto-oligosyltrehalose synthase [Bryobacterales bacterium]
MTASTTISATYRLQFNKDFTFPDASGLLGYFSELGVTHIYASPILRSRRGSSHGYDVIDPNHVNSELGTEADFQAFHEELEKRGMGLIVDVVPNHMAASSENAWWMDVLEHGPESAYASYFDIDWRALEGKILLPFLGRPFAEVLENQDFALTYVEGKFFVQYFEWLFPLAPRSYRRILEHRLDDLRTKLGEDSPAYHEYAGITAAAVSSSDRETISTITATRGENRLQFEQLTARLRQLVSANPDVQAFLLDNLNGFEGVQGNPASFSPLERLLAEQFYVLAYWHNLNLEINYRRFFTITDLVGVRVADPLVFESTHSLVARQVEQNAVSGLRIDHIDGLRDPLGYLNRLNERIAEPVLSAETKRFPVYVEKILARNERLRGDWPVAGTTGYDFLNAMNYLFVHPEGAQSLERIYCEFLGREVDYRDLLYQKKQLVMATLFGSELRSLGHHMAMLASQDRYARDVPRHELTQALNETTACLGVYRTYIRNLEVSHEDQAVIEQAITEAQTLRPQLHPLSFAFVRDVFLLQNRPHLLPQQREARLAFVIRWQQFTGPIMAKSFEDTLLYVYNPLVSLNEVGGDPRPSAASPDLFHELVQERSQKWPQSLNASTTHDTKQSEDVRARINVLSEIPEDWERHLHCWSKLNACHRKLIQGQPVPDRNEEIFLYQTLIGMWPFDAEERVTVNQRLQEYAIKATREAKVHTRWTLPNLPHEDALKSFIAEILDSRSDNAFLRDFTAFHNRIAYCAMINGLSQTLLKIISPGIPDFYQGSELWDFRLVDPDNRHSVDFTKRKVALARMQQDKEARLIYVADGLAKNWRDGWIQLYLIWKALNYRRRHGQLFSQGDFSPAMASGSRQENVSGYCRRKDEEWLLVAFPKWLANAGAAENSQNQPQFWGDTHLLLPATAPASWQNVFTGEELSASKSTGGQQSLLPTELFQYFPVAMLEGS